MNKIKTKLILLFIFSAILFSCTNDLNNEENKVNLKNSNSIKNAKLLVNKSTDLITDLSFNLGASNIILESNIVKFDSKKGFYFSGKYFDLKNFTFKIDNNKLTLMNNSKYSIEINENLIYLTNEYSHFLINEKNIELQRDINIFVLRIMLNELFIEKEKESFSNKLPPDGEGNGVSCSFWNTVYCVGVGLTQSAAIADMNYEIADAQASGDLLGCVKLGNAEAVAFSGGLAWATAYCCR